MRSSVRGTAGFTETHATGVAQLFEGEPRKALTALKSAAEGSTDPSAWNDLAAAFHETALHYDAGELLAEALAAADRSLDFAPDFPEALFNRALIIEHLGLRDDARLAWQRYLVVDAGSRWAVEARKHLEALAPEVPLLELLDRDYDRVAASATQAMALVKRNPFDARAAGVKEILGRWGEAVARGDAVDAHRHLRVARQLGDAIASGSGDRMLQRAVATIDHADGARRVMLAAGHVHYREGSRTFQANHPGEGEALLRRARSEFEQAGSPMVIAARYLAANAAVEQGRHEEAEQEHRLLLAIAGADFAGYRALILLLLGGGHVSRAEWGPAITTLEEAESAFDRLGEERNVAAVRRLLAFAYDRIGDRTTAWKYRVSSLRGTGQRTDVALGKEMSSIADAAIIREEWRTAASFLNLQVAIARRLNDDVSLGDTLLIRAVVRDRLNDPSGAMADITEAKAAAARSTDPSYRAHLHFAELRASAMLAATSPREADVLLTEAIEYQSNRSDPLNLPGLFLQRARARRNDGDPAGAMSDVRRGIAELERHRQSLPEGEARWGAFHAAEELFAEGIDLSISSGDAEAAFRFAEKGRARALLDSYRRAPVLDDRRLPARTAVVEYAALPSRLVIFIADATGVRATVVDCEREKLAAAVAAFSQALQQNEKTSITAPNLYALLVAPVAPQLLGADTVVFVPDATTSTVAFSALPDPRGEYLLESHGAVVIAPSAAAFAATAERRGHPSAPKSALVLASSQPGAGVDALASVKTEARLVAATYTTATPLQDDAAELEQLTKLGPTVDVIHFAGHAIGDDRAIEPASILLRENGRERRVGAAELAKLRLRPTAVVVLAGCNTARGERRAAEGVISVAHGFLTAGAASVIATLWPIDDEAAAEFFPRLHRKLAEGMSAAEALRATQLESIRRGDVPVSMWAAVQDIGS